MFEVAAIVLLLLLMLLSIWTQVQIHTGLRVGPTERYYMDKCPKCKEREVEVKAENERKHAEKEAELARYQREYEEIEARILNGDIPTYDFEVRGGLFRSKEHKICVPVAAIECIDMTSEGSYPGWHIGFGEHAPIRRLAVIHIRMKSGNKKRVECHPPEVDFVLEAMHNAWQKGLEKND